MNFAVANLSVATTDGTGTASYYIGNGVVIKGKADVFPMAQGLGIKIYDLHLTVDPLISIARLDATRLNMDAEKSLGAVHAAFDVGVLSMESMRAPVFEYIIPADPRDRGHDSLKTLPDEMILAYAILVSDGPPNSTTKSR